MSDTFWHSTSIAKKRALYCVVLPLLIVSCGGPRPETGEQYLARMALLPPDDTYRSEVASKTVSLKIQDSISSQPIPLAVLLGRARGVRKPEYVYQGGGSFAGGGGPNVDYKGPLVATDASLTSAQASEYLLDGASTFGFSELGRKIANHLDWDGHVVAPNYCVQKRGDAAVQIANAIAGLSPVNSNPIAMVPIEVNETQRVRYFTNFLTYAGLSRIYGQAPHLGNVANTLINIAAPTSAAPLPNATFIGLLRSGTIALAPNTPLGDLDRRYFNHIESHAKKHMNAAREIYYVYDDWRIVRSQWEVVWPQSPALKSDNCKALNDDSRIPTSSSFGGSFPILPNDDFYAATKSPETFNRSDMAKLLQLKPFPFCIRAITEKASVSHTEEHAALKQDFTLWCRNKGKMGCSYDTVNANGDTPLISLARERNDRYDRYAFAINAADPSDPSAEKGFGRADVSKMTRLLMSAGANPSLTNPALGVNALEAALDSFLSRAISKNVHQKDDFWQSQIEIVEAFVDYFERTRHGQLRDDYVASIQSAVASGDVSTSKGREPAWLLPRELTQRLLSLPRRELPLMCKESLGWFQWPGQYHHDIRLSKPHVALTW
jgi:hypothetical protein